jgi:hypothetical protein
MQTSEQFVCVSSCLGASADRVVSTGSDKAHTDQDVPNITVQKPVSALTPR